MSRADVRAANRALLWAIDAAPPAGVEDRLDTIAAATWAYANADEPDRGPSPGRVRHLECKLAGLARATEGDKRWRIERARARLRRYATETDDV